MPVLHRLAVRFPIENISVFAEAHCFDCFPFARTIFLAPGELPELVINRGRRHPAEPRIQLCRISERADTRREFRHSEVEHIVCERARRQEPRALALVHDVVVDPFPKHPHAFLQESFLYVYVPRVSQVDLTEASQFVTDATAYC